MELLDERRLVGPNWKVAYDGYVDGYHLDILHKDTLGKDVMGNVMTCDAWGPHQRVAFARRNLGELRDVPRAEWKPAAHMGLVHTVFPHVSVAGNGGSGMMVSTLCPGPTPDRSTHDPDPRRARRHQRRGPGGDAQASRLPRVGGQRGGLQDRPRHPGRASPPAPTPSSLFGANEPGNQRFHQWVDKLVLG